MNNRRFILALLYVCNSSVVNSTESPDRFYIIGHQKNDIITAEEAFLDGANAVEIDINFDPNTGRPTEFGHRWPCDVDNLSQLLGECSRRTPYKELLGYLAEQEGLALVILEGKVNRLSTHIQRVAGRNAVRMIEDEVFEKGFRGNIVIGCFNEHDFITSAAEAVQSSKYKSQIYFTLLRDYSGAVSTINYLHTLPTPNIVYSIGMLTREPKTYHEDVQLAALNKVHGSVSAVCVWTLNYERHFEAYYNSGVRGITTNNVRNLATWAHRKNLTLAQPGDDTLRPTWSTEILTSLDTEANTMQHTTDL